MIFQLAGIVGVDPWPYTLRQLQWMANAAIDARWAETASVMSLIANTHRKKTQRPFTPQDFHPRHAKHSGNRIRITRDNFGALKRLAR